MNTLRKKKGVRRLAVLILTAAMLVIQTSPVLAAASLKPGDKVSYKHSDSTSLFTVEKLNGKCCQSGTPAGAEGTATVERVINNSSQLAKIAYYFTYVENRLKDTSKPDDADYWQYIDSNWANVFGDALGYTEMGASAWRTAVKEGAGFSDQAVETIENTIKKMIQRSANVTVPSGFHMYRLKTEDDVQDFMVWEYNPSGYLTVQKSAQRPNYNDPNASLAGAVYYVYTDQACTTRAKDVNGNDIALTTDANGNATAVELESDKTYYVKEVTASPGYSLDPNVYSKKVTSSHTQSSPAKVSSQEPKTTGHVYLQKISGNTDITG